MGSGLRRLALAAAAAVALVAGASVPAGEAATPCLAPSAAFVKALKNGIRPAYRSRVAKVRAVQSGDVFFSAPSAMRQRDFFVSAAIRGVGTATWVLEPRAYLTGNGHILSVEKTARKVSLFGQAISAATVRSWGFGPTADGYAKSRACLHGR